MWQISMAPALILLIIGTNHKSVSLLPSAKYQHSTVNVYPVRGHRNFGTNLTLKVNLKKSLNSEFI